MSATTPDSSSPASGDAPDASRAALFAGVASAADLQTALTAIVEALEADSGTVHLLEEDGVLHLRASVNIPDEVQSMVRLVPIGKGMAGLAVERDRPVDACNIQTDTSGDVRPGARKTGMEGAIVVPIRRDGSVVGALGVANRGERTFTEAEIALLEQLGSVLADRA